AGKNPRVSILDLNTGKKERSYPMPLQGQGHESITGAISPDGKLVAATGPEHVIHLWERDSGKRLLRLRGQGWLIQTAGWSQDGKSIAWGRNVHLDGKSLGERRPLEHIFDLTQMRLVTDRMEPMDPTEYRRAVLNREGVTLTIQQPPLLERGGLSIPLPG